MASKTLLRVFLLVFIFLSVFSFWWFDLGQFLSLDYLRSSQERVRALYVQDPLLMMFGFGLFYTLMAGLSLPGAGVMTVAAGAFFGLLKGTIVVSIASTLGATLAFFLARTLLREWVLTRFGDKLETINNGISKEGAFYLFSLRLIPIFPFFVINVVMALTTMKIRTFAGVSQIGMLPATIIFVNAGREIAKIDSLSGILSPSLIFSFCLIGILPITMKKMVELWKRRA